jgi:hypothetical protein
MILPYHPHSCRSAGIVAAPPRPDLPASSSGPDIGISRLDGGGCCCDRAGSPTTMKPTCAGPTEAPLAPRASCRWERWLPGPYHERTSGRGYAATARPLCNLPSGKVAAASRHERAPARMRPSFAGPTEAPLAPREACRRERRLPGPHHERAAGRGGTATARSRCNRPSGQAAPLPRPHRRSGRSESGGSRIPLPSGNCPILACDPMHREKSRRAGGRERPYGGAPNSRSAWVRPPAPASTTITCVAPTPTIWVPSTASAPIKPPAAWNAVKLS